MPEVAFRVAVVGAGYTAREHVRAFADVQGVVVAGIYSRTRARAEALAGEFGIETVAGSVPELYEKTRAELVVVAVPELAMNAVSKASFGFPWAALLEKPPGYCPADAQDIRAAAQAASARVFVGLNRRFIGATATALEQAAGRPGARYIRVQDQQNPVGARAAGQPPEVVDHWMYANSIHTVDYLRVFGRGGIVGVRRVVPWNPAAPGVVVAEVRFSSGDLGLYEAIWNGPGPWAVAVTVPGNRWELRPLERLEIQELGGAKFPADVSPWDTHFKPGFRAQAEAVVAAARGLPSRAVSIADAGETMALISDIYRS
jgi:predicted dehydrogenase